MSAPGFDCEYCGEQFRSSALYKRHVVEEHPEGQPKSLDDELGREQTEEHHTEDAEADKGDEDHTDLQQMTQPTALPPTSMAQPAALDVAGEGSLGMDTDAATEAAAVAAAAAQVQVDATQQMQHQLALDAHQMGGYQMPYPIAMGQIPRPHMPALPGAPRFPYVPPGALPQMRFPPPPRPPTTEPPKPVSVPLNPNMPPAVGVKRSIEEEGAPADSDEDKKRRNRAAAQRCRLKKKKQVQELEARSTHLIRENTDLRNAQQKLLEELSQLKTQIMQHQRDCPLDWKVLPPGVPTATPTLPPAVTATSAVTAAPKDVQRPPPIPTAPPPTAVVATATAPPPTNSPLMPIVPRNKA